MQVEKFPLVFIFAKVELLLSIIWSFCNSEYSSEGSYFFRYVLAVSGQMHVFWKEWRYFLPEYKYSHPEIKVGDIYLIFAAKSASNRLASSSVDTRMFLQSAWIKHFLCAFCHCSVPRLLLKCSSGWNNSF